MTYFPPRFVRRVRSTTAYCYDCGLELVGQPAVYSVAAEPPCLIRGYFCLRNAQAYPLLRAVIPEELLEREEP